MSNKQYYEEGLRISKDFNKRKKADTEKLYYIIKIAASSINSENKREANYAREFLAQLYSPLIKKTATQLYDKLKKYIDYEDIIQEAYTMLFSLLERYDSERAALTYYIGRMLPQHMRRWSEKEVFYHTVNIPVDPKDNTTIDTVLNSEDMVASYFNSLILLGEYEEFIRKRAQRFSHSRTASVVCHKFFLGSSTCLEISKELGISYHAVYEIIGKIKEELKAFFAANIYSEYFVSSTGIAIKNNI